MKIIVGLLVICAIVALIAYYGGGVGSFDPNKAGREAKAAITPGMTWKKVVDVAGTPKAYRAITKQVRQGIETLRPGPENPFDADKLAERIADNMVEHGFTFTYVFSKAVAFDVRFDAAGNALRVTDRITEADLLQMNP